MEDQKQDSVSLLDEKLKGDLSPIESPEMSAALIDLSAIDQMILANQLKYIDAQLDTDEENKLYFENLKDFRAYPLEVQDAAIKHADASQYDSEYFKRNNVDEALHKPMSIYNTIKAKRDEAKTKAWTVEYRARLINRLKAYRKQCVKRETEINDLNQNGFQRFINLLLRK